MIEKHDLRLRLRDKAGIIIRYGARKNSKEALEIGEVLIEAAKALRVIEQAHEDIEQALDGAVKKGVKP